MTADGPAGTSGSKLAAAVAGRIVRDVIDRDWPVGEVLGSEAELLDRYGVSRAVFREAVRLVEQQQVVWMRRGPGGGLVVIEPTVEAVIDAAVLYLYRVGARLDEVFAARLVLEEMVTELAPHRLDEDDLSNLRAWVDEEGSGDITDRRALHTMLASISRNPALELFVEILNRVTTLYFTDASALRSATLSASTHAHARIAEAVMAGDSGLAKYRMRKHLEAEADFIRRRRSTRQVMDLAAAFIGSPGGKRADVVAKQVFLDIEDKELQPGDLVGSEPDLMEAYDVSRAVFREAVRLLEHHHVASMRRGPGGGLFVEAPNAGAVTDIVALYLQRRGLRGPQLAELRIGVELALVGLAADRVDEAGAERLSASLEAERYGSAEERAQAVHDLHTAVAAVADNRALELVALVLIQLSRLRQIEKLPKRAFKEIAEQVHHTHGAIAESVISGDRELARHRMYRHLEALRPYIQ